MTENYKQEEIIKNLNNYKVQLHNIIETQTELFKNSVTIAVFHNKSIAMIQQHYFIKITCGRGAITGFNYKAS